jgi:hypothetical protein
MPRLAAVPAVNREGFSRVTFLGYEDCEKLNKETGEISVYTKLKFEILDKTKVDPIKTNVVGSALNERELWDTVQGLGYVEPESDDDFEDADDDIDSEADETSKVFDGLNHIVEFLEAIAGKKFICKVERDRRGYWAIKPDTLKPYQPKTSV